MYRRPMGSYILNILLIFGRERDSICSLSLLIDGIVSECLIIMFQEAAPLGKKLFIYLGDRHLISRRVLLISALNRYGLLFGANFSLRHEGVITFIIL